MSDSVIERKWIKADCGIYPEAGVRVLGSVGVKAPRVEFLFYSNTTNTWYSADSGTPLPEGYVRAWMPDIPPFEE